MRTVMTPIKKIAMALLLAAGSATTGRADLVYESYKGASLIYDTATSTTWTQDGNLSGTAYVNQADAVNWAGSLTTAGLSWTLPTSAEFTSLYTQLDPVGAPGTEDNKYGSQVNFGTGPNDYALNVEMIYWTSVTGTDFNFNYGYPGTPTSNAPLYAWAVDSNTPLLVPEPASITLTLAGLASLILSLRTRSRAE